MKPVDDKMAACRARCLQHSLAAADTFHSMGTKVRVAKK